MLLFVFFFQAEDGIRDLTVTGVQTCALPILLLPIAPFTETSGSFVNAEGRLQSFHAVVKPLAEARPGWKVLRVLANLLGVQGVDYETSQEIGRASCRERV